MKIKKIDKENILVTTDKKKVTVSHDQDGNLQAYRMNTEKNIGVDSPGEFEYDALGYVAIETAIEGEYKQKINLMSISTESNINVVFYFLNKKLTKEELQNVPIASLLVTNIQDTELLKDVTRSTGSEMALVILENKDEDVKKKIKAAFPGAEELEGTELKVDAKDFDSDEDSQMQVFVMS